MILPDLKPDWSVESTEDFCVARHEGLGVELAAESTRDGFFLSFGRINEMPLYSTLPVRTVDAAKAEILSLLDSAKLLGIDADETMLFAPVASSVVEYESDPASHIKSPHAESYPLSFGKYKGKTLQEIANHDGAYIEWLSEANVDRLSEEQRDELIYLAEQIQSVPAPSDPIIGFGKHSGLAVSEAAEKHPDYILWLSERDIRDKDLKVAVASAAENILLKRKKSVELTAEGKELIDRYGIVIDQIDDGTYLVVGLPIGIGSISSTMALREIFKSVSMKKGVWRIEGASGWTVENVEGGVAAAILKMEAEAGKRIAEAMAAPIARLGDAEATDLVSEDVKEKLRRGMEFGIPAAVIAEQTADVGKMMASYVAGKPAFLLASKAGTGKTFVLGAFIDELRLRGDSTPVVYFTLNQDLIAQIKADLSSYDLSDVHFHTYAEASEGKLDMPYGAIVISDEAHSLMNTESARGGFAQKKFVHAKFWVPASATPIENPLDAKYLAVNGMFEEEGFKSFEEWAVTFGAYERKFQPPGENYTITKLEWVDNVEYAKLAREWFFDRGLATQRELKIPIEKVNSLYTPVAIDPVHADIYQRVEASYKRLLERLEASGLSESKDYASIKQHRENMLKRILESGKVESAATRAFSAIERGRYPVIFVESRSEKTIGRWKKMGGKPGDPVYTYPEMIDMMKEYQVEAELARRNGDGDVSAPPFSTFIMEIAGAFYDDGIDVVIPSVVDQFKDLLNEELIAEYTGRIPLTRATENLKQWRDGRKKILISTMAKGGTGQSYHDKVGDHQTTQIVTILPWTSRAVDQVAGRTARYGLVGTAEVDWLFAPDIESERRLFNRVNRRLRNLAASVDGKEHDGAIGMASAMESPADLELPKSLEFQLYNGDISESEYLANAGIDISEAAIERMRREAVHKAQTYLPYFQLLSEIGKALDGMTSNFRNGVRTEKGEALANHLLECRETMVNPLEFDSMPRGIVSRFRLRIDKAMCGLETRLASIADALMKQAIVEYQPDTEQTIESQNQDDIINDAGVTPPKSEDAFIGSPPSDLPWNKATLIDEKKWQGSLVSIRGVDGKLHERVLVDSVYQEAISFLDGGMKKVLRNSQIEAIRLESLCEFLGNGKVVLNKGKTWSTKGRAEFALKKLGLQETHFADGSGNSGDREWWLREKPALTGVVATPDVVSEGVCHYLEGQSKHDVLDAKSVAKHYDWMSVKKVDGREGKGKEWAIVVSDSDSEKVIKMLTQEAVSTSEINREYAIRRKFNELYGKDSEAENYPVEFLLNGKKEQVIVSPGRAPSHERQLSGLQLPLTVTTLSMGETGYIAVTQKLNGRNVLTDDGCYPVDSDSWVVKMYRQAGFEIPDQSPLRNPDEQPSIESLIGIVADSWDKLRIQDVFRLIHNAAEIGSDFQKDLVATLKDNRPDLAEEADEVLLELAEEASKEEVVSVVESGSPSVRIEDTGYVKGARKELFQSKKYIDQLAAGSEFKSLGEAIPRPDVTEMIKDGVAPRAVALILVLRNTIGRRPADKFQSKVSVWNDRVEAFRNTIEIVLNPDLIDREMAALYEADGMMAVSTSIPATADYIALFAPDDMEKAASQIVLKKDRYSHGIEYQPAATDDKVRYQYVKNNQELSLQYFASPLDAHEKTSQQFMEAIEKAQREKKANNGIKVELYHQRQRRVVFAVGLNGGGKFQPLEALPRDLKYGSEEADREAWLLANKGLIAERYNVGESNLEVGLTSDEETIYMAGYKPRGGKTQILELLPEDLANNSDRQKWLAENSERLINIVEEVIGFKLREPENRERRGGRDYRKGLNVTAEQLVAEFGLNVVQFGNSTLAAQKKAQARINEAYDALHDLASVLGISPRAIGLGGALSIGFGSQGKGGLGKSGLPAAAHYSPNNVLINLTQKNGAGSLAHEWFHALDNFVAKLSSTAELEETHAPLGLFASDGVITGLREPLKQAFERIGVALKSDEYLKSSRGLDGFLGKKSAYWSTNTEMAARAFEAYVKFKLEDQGIENDFLVNVNASQEGLEGVVPSRQGLKAFGFEQAFGDLFGSVIEKERAEGVYLTRQESPNPVVFAKHQLATVKTWIAQVEDDTGVKIHVVESKDSLPSRLAKITPDHIAGIYDLGTGTPYVIADRVRDSEHAIKVALHEGLGHGGVLAFLERNAEEGGKQVVSVLDDIYEGVGARNIQKVVRGYDIDYRSAAGRREAVLEYVAILAESGRKPDIRKRAVFTTIDMMESMYGTVSWTEADVISLIEASRVHSLIMSVEKAGVEFTSIEDRGAKRKSAIQRAVAAAGGSVDRLLKSGESLLAWSVPADWAANVGLTVPDIQFASSNIVPVEISIANNVTGQLIDVNLRTNEQSTTVLQALRSLGIYDAGLAEVHKAWLDGDAKIETYPGDTARNEYDIGQLPAAAVPTLLSEKMAIPLESAHQLLSDAGILGLQTIVAGKPAVALFDETFAQQVTCRGEILARVEPNALNSHWHAAFDEAKGPLSKAEANQAKLLAEGRWQPGVLYRQGLELPETGHARETVKEWIESVEKYTATTVQVLDNAQALPEHLRAGLPEDVAAVYDPVRRVPYLIADRITDEAHAVKSALHEGLGHAGIINYLRNTEAFGGRKVNQILDDIYASLSAEMTDIVELYGLDPRTQYDRTEAVLEYLAFQAEKHQVMPAITDGMVSVLENTHGDLAWTYEDVMNLIEAARLFTARERVIEKSSEIDAAYDNVMAANESRLKKLLSNSEGIRVWHGSPHTFENVNFSKIGSGEGAQAYGWGVYTTDGEGTGRFYEKSLGVQSNAVYQDGEVVGRLSDRALSHYFKSGSDSDRAVNIFLEAGKNWDRAAAVAKELNESPEIIAEINRLKFVVVPADRGNVYEFEIDAKDEELLHFDRPIHDQSPIVQQFFRQFREKIGYGPSMQEVLPTWGQEYLSDVRANGFTDPRILEAVKAAIKEIAYNDQYSSPAWAVINRYPALRMDPNDLHDMRDASGRLGSGHLLIGEHAYYEMLNIRAAEDEKDLAAMLSAAGIKGIRYRGNEKNTYNYVSFSSQYMKSVARQDIGSALKQSEIRVALDIQPSAPVSVTSLRSAIDWGASIVEQSSDVIQAMAKLSSKYKIPAAGIDTGAKFYQALEQAAGDRKNELVKDLIDAGVDGIIMSAGKNLRENSDLYHEIRFSDSLHATHTPTPEVDEGFMYRREVDPVNPLRTSLGEGFLTDDLGRTRYFYHGTDSDFENFQSGRVGVTYFTPDLEHAKEYGETIKVVALKIANIADLTDETSQAYKMAVNHFNQSGGWEWNPDVMADRESADYDPDQDYSWEMFDAPEYDLTELLKNNGYDGVKLTEYSGVSYVPFSLEQIKSLDAYPKDEFLMSEIKDIKLANTWVANQYGEPAVVYSTSEQGLFSTQEGPEMAVVNIANPIVNMGVHKSNVADPYIDLKALAEKLNLTTREKLELANDMKDYIYNTDNWDVIAEEYDCNSINDLQAIAPEKVDDIYFEVMPVLRSEKWASRIQAEGYDGAIFGASGPVAAVAVYAFNADQVYILDSEANADLVNQAVRNSPHGKYADELAASGYAVRPDGNQMFVQKDNLDAVIDVSNGVRVTSVKGYGPLAAQAEQMFLRAAENAGSVVNGMTVPARTTVVQEIQQSGKEEALIAQRYAEAITHSQGIDLNATVYGSPSEIRSELGENFGKTGPVAGAMLGGTLYLASSEMSSPMAVEAAVLQAAAEAGQETQFHDSIVTRSAELIKNAGGMASFIDLASESGVDLSAHLSAYKNLPAGQKSARLVEKFIDAITKPDLYRKILGPAREAVQGYFSGIRADAEAAGLMGLALAAASKLNQVVGSINKAYATPTLDGQLVVLGTSEQEQAWVHEIEQKLVSEYHIPLATAINIVEKNDHLLREIYRDGEAFESDIAILRIAPEIARKAVKAREVEQEEDLTMRPEL